MKLLKSKICTIGLAAIFIFTATGLPAKAQDPFPNCRLGAGGVTNNVIGYDMEQLNMGLYLDWRARNPPAGLPETVEYIQVVRVHQAKDDYGSGWFGPPRQYLEPPSYHVSPSLTEIANIATSQPGALWLIGNEIERVDWPEGDGWGGQDEITPELYATAFHQISAAIKAADPTARVSIGGIIQATPLRLEYLDRVWDSYQNQYGYPMGQDIDVWNVHGFIIREVLDEWGADIPAGFDNTDDDPTNDFDPADGLLYNANYNTTLRAHHDMDYYTQLIEDFRAWMAAHGEQNKPLINTEYGILMNLNNNQIINFLENSFDYMFAATDPDTGYPADEYRLLQGWVWYSLNDDFSVFDHGTLLDSNKNLTAIGNAWKNYVTDPAHPLASQPQQNLLATNLHSTPNPAYALPGNSTLVTLKANIANSGNTKSNSDNNIAVSFWDDDPANPGANQIGSTQIIDDIPGCGQFTTVKVDWLRQIGEHPWYVKIDPIANETNQNDNVANSTAIVLEGTPTANLSISKTVSNPSPPTDSIVAYTITITNGGPDPATNVIVDDPLPSGVIFNSYNATKGTYTSTNGIWSIDFLSPQHKAMLTLSARIETGQGGNTITNQATASATEEDSTPFDNIATVDIVPVANADLALFATADETETEIIYNLLVENYGPDLATNVQVNHFILPEGLSLQTYSATQGTYNSTTGRWQIGQVAKNLSASLIVTTTIDAGQNGGPFVIENINVSADEVDFEPGNNTGNVSVGATNNSVYLPVILK